MGLTLCYYAGYASLGDVLDTTVKMREILESLLRIYVTGDVN